MPTYKYTCSDCGEIFSKLVKFEDRDDALECPECGADSKRGFAAPDESAVVMETGCAFHGKQVLRGINKIMKKRAKEHFAKEEAPEVREKHGHQTLSRDMINNKGDGFRKPEDDE